MNNDLIKNLQEADLFSSPNKKELKDREANRPPKVLEHQDIVDVLRATLPGVILEFGSDEIMDMLMSGTPVTEVPILEMNSGQLLEEVQKWIHVFMAGEHAIGSLNTHGRKKVALLKMIQKYTGETYTDIEGF